MSTYFEARKNDGSVTLDDKTSRLCLQRYGSLWDLSTSVSVSTYSYHGGGDPNTDRRCVTALQFTVPVTIKELIIGFKFLKSDFGTCINYTRKSSTEILVNVYSSPSGLYPGSNNDSIKKLAEAIKMYTFGEDVNEVDRFGLEIFDENGRKIFNSSEKIFRLIDKYEYEYNFFGKNFNSLPLSFTAKENSRKLIVVPNQFLSAWTRSPNSTWLPCPSLYGISFADNNIYSRLIVTVGSFGDYDWTGGQSVLASYLFADATYLP